MAACLASPAASAGFRYVDEGLQALCRYAVGVYNAPIERCDMEKRVKTDTTLIETAKAGANVPYLLYGHDRLELETKFREVEANITELQTIVEEGVKRFDRFKWPFRRHKIKQKLQEIENDMQAVLDQSKRYHIYSSIINLLITSK